jgi:hypothetical protein
VIASLEKGVLGIIKREIPSSSCTGKKRKLDGESKTLNALVKVFYLKR